MLDEVGRWLRRRSWRVADRPLEDLLAVKRRTGTTVSVVLPALDEEATVGDIVSVIRRELATPHPGTGTALVDELIVMNSGSTDRTAEVAAAAGAEVVHRDEVLPRLPPRPGKGEVLWRSLLATSGDIVCFVDADLREFSPDFVVTGIVGPLLTEPDVHLVKAMYDRPLRDSPAGGGRVTELVARPLLNLHWPRLAGLVQPLGGEYAAPAFAAGAAAVPGGLRGGAGAAGRHAGAGGAGRTGPGRRGGPAAPQPGRAGARPDGDRHPRGGRAPHRAGPGDGGRRARRDRGAVGRARRR